MPNKYNPVRPISVAVTWRFIQDEQDPLWDRKMVLYAYMAGTRIEYIGKAERKTVWERFKSTDKAEYVASASERMARGSSIRVIVGIPRAEPGARVTFNVLRDIEALLIFRLKPKRNIKGIASSLIRRPGMRVRCEGDWPYKRSSFINR